MLIPDPASTEREKLAKAQMDHAAYTEAQRRAAAAEEAELVAPLAERHGPLPERLPTLRYLAPEDQQLYAKDVDGSFVLRYVRINDEHTVTAYTDRIGRGLTVLGEGETPASRKAQQIRQQEMTDRVNAILARDTKAKADQERAAIEERQAKERQAHEQERERHLASRRSVDHANVY